MSAALRETVLAYLRDHTVLTLATSGPAGLWAAAVFYANEGFNLYFLSAPTSRHSLNIAATGTVAGTIQENYRDWTAIKGIQLAGPVTRLARAAQAEAIRLYGEKYPLVGQADHAPPAIAKALHQVAWYKIEPSELYFVDNAQGFGHRDQVRLP